MGFWATILRVTINSFTRNFSMLALLSVGPISAMAYVPGQYTCGFNGGWKEYQVTIKNVKLDTETNVPFATYKSDLQTISGFATVSTNGDSEKLQLGMYDLVFFKAGKLSGRCRQMK